MAYIATSSFASPVVLGMLRINPHSSASAATLYYTQSRHEYYAREQSGVWRGQAAHRLGLRGTVRQEDFASLADNLHPKSGSRLTVRTKANRRIGYDFNFHPPKSVSVAYALTKDKRILDAFEEAVDYTMRQIEVDAKARVRIQGQDHDEVTGNLIWSRFTHTTTRPVKGIPDPQLHCHCFVFNATFDEQERRWKAAQFGDIKGDGAYYQAILHSRLAGNYARLGLKLRRKGSTFELADVPESLVRKFSRRRQQIDEVAVAKGMTSAKARDVLGKLTREPKKPSLSDEEVDREWHSRVSPTERQAIARFQVIAPPAEPPVPRPRDHELESAAIAYARKAVFQQRSVVDERHFLQKAVGFAVDNLEPQTLLARIRKDPTLIRREHEGRSVITTPEIIEEEQQILRWVEANQDAAEPLAPHFAPSSYLSVEQQLAALHMVNSRARITAVIGRAGTGKTTLMRETIAAIEGEGTPVIVVAPSSDASRGTLKKAGFPAADTVAMLFKSEALQAKVRDGVIWIDEAGLLGNQDLLRIMGLADELDARIVLAGDTRQHRSVSRGDALRLVVDHSSLEVAELKDNRRQSGLYKAAVDRIAENRLLEAFEKLDEAGAIHEIDGPERFDFIAKQYLTFRQEDPETLIVSPTHLEARLATSAVRQALRAAGQLGEEKRFIQLRRVDLLDADKERPATYELGWVIEMLQTNSGHRRGARYVVSHVADGEVYVRHADGSTRRFDVARLHHAFNVYERVVANFAVGDRIRITQNGKDAHGVALNNGDIQTVAGFTEGGDIHLADGRVVSDKYAHFSHGYVTTSYVAQGKTVRHVIVVEGAESFPAGNREQFYVSVSRGRISATIVTTDRDALFEAMMRSAKRPLALATYAPAI